MVLIRMVNPDLWHPAWGGEKPFEFGLLNAVLRSPVMPPYSPFFSGGTINYYYYGYVLLSLPIRLTGVLPEIGYNLVLASLYALVVTGVAAVLWQIAQRRWVALIGALAMGVWGNHATAGYQPASTAITTSNIGSQSVNYANSAGSSTTTLRGIVEDTRGGQRTPTDYDDYRVSWEFTNQIPGLNSGGSTWWSAMTIQGWHDGYAAWQIIGPASSAVEDFYLRSGNNATWNTF